MKIYWLTLLKINFRTTLDGKLLGETVNFVESKGVHTLMLHTARVFIFYFEFYYQVIKCKMFDLTRFYFRFPTYSQRFD